MESGAYPALGRFEGDGDWEAFVAQAKARLSAEEDEWCQRVDHARVRSEAPARVEAERAPALGASGRATARGDDESGDWERIVAQAKARAAAEERVNQLNAARMQASGAKPRKPQRPPRAATRVPLHSQVVPKAEPPAQPISMAPAAVMAPARVPAVEPVISLSLAPIATDEEAEWAALRERARALEEEEWQTLMARAASMQVDEKRAQKPRRPAKPKRDEGASVAAESIAVRALTVGASASQAPKPATPLDPFAPVTRERGAIPEMKLQPRVVVAWP